MTRTDAAVLALRIAGIWAWIRAIEHVPVLFSPLWPGFDSTSVGWTFFAAMPVALFLAGAVLVFAAPRLAHAVLPATENDATPVSADGLLEPAFAVIGIAVLVLAIPRLAQLGVDCVNRDWPGYPYDRHLWTLSIQVVLQIGLGLGLFLRGRWLAGLWRRLALARTE